MDQRGWVKLPRAIRDEPLWREDRRFSGFEAWLDLYLSAHHTETEVVVNNGPLLIRRGQVFTSQVGLANRWRWDRKTVRRFLGRLERSSKVVLSTSKRRDMGWTIITLCNYEQMSIDGTVGSPCFSPSKSPSNPHAMPHSQEGEEWKEEEVSREGMGEEVLAMALPKDMFVTAGDAGMMPGLTGGIGEQRCMEKYGKSGETIKREVMDVVSQSSESVTADGMVGIFSGARVVSIT